LSPGVPISDIPAQQIGPTPYVKQYQNIRMSDVSVPLPDAKMPIGSGESFIPDQQGFKPGMPS